VIEWLAYLAEEDILPNGYNLQLTAIGMLADQAKPIFYRQEQMPLSVSALKDATAYYAISQAISESEKVSNILNFAAQILAKHVLMRGGDAEPDKGDIRNLVKQWGVLSIFWMNLEPIFWDYVASLNDEAIDSNQAWRDVLRQQAREGLAGIAHSSGNNAAALKGQINAERQLNAQLKKLFNE